MSTYEKEENEVFEISRIRLYREIKASLIRNKNELIDRVLKEEQDMNDILIAVGDIIDSYEMNRLFFKYTIFDEPIPDNLAKRLFKDSESKDTDKNEE